MKNLKYLAVLTLLPFVSCEDYDVVGQLDDMTGTWQLTEMTYTDPQGTTRTISDSETTLTFTKEIAGGGDENVDGVRYGIQGIGEETFRYQYSVDFSQNNIDILFEEDGVKEQLPLDAVGRNQVYKFEQTDDSHIVISTEVETNRDKLNSEVLTNVRYTFEKQ